jgi:hypothetical protein
MGEETLEKSKSDLTVVCFLWGLWGIPKAIDYVNNLFQSVNRHLNIPHRFVCFSDRAGIAIHPDIEMITLSKDEIDLRWNLTKMVVYKPDNGLTGRVLLFDLDVVIVGCIDELAQYDGEFITCKAAYVKSGIGGSLIGFEAGYGAEELWKPLMGGKRGFHEAMTDGSERKYFDMRLRRHGHHIDFWQDLYPGQVLSYKVHCQKTNCAPDNVRVVRFHGHPRPHEVKDNWVMQYWK